MSLEDRNFGTVLLVIKVNQKVYPVTDFRYTISKEKSRIHTVHAHNRGVFHGPLEIEFTIRMLDIGEELGQITSMMLNNTQFSLEVGKFRATDTDEWTFLSLIFERCYVTRQEVSNINPRNLHDVMLQCIALDYSHKPVSTGVQESFSEL